MRTVTSLVLIVLASTLVVLLGFFKQTEKNTIATLYSCDKNNWVVLLLTPKTSYLLTEKYLSQENLYCLAKYLNLKNKNNTHLVYLHKVITRKNSNQEKFLSPHSTELLLTSTSLLSLKDDKSYLPYLKINNDFFLTLENARNYEDSNHKKIIITTSGLEELYHLADQPLSDNNLYLIRDKQCRLPQGLKSRIICFQNGDFYKVSIFNNLSFVTNKIEN